jgi:hypothetical protein
MLIFGTSSVEISSYVNKEFAMNTGKYEKFYRKD